MFGGGGHGSCPVKGLEKFMSERGEAIGEFVRSLAENLSAIWI